MNKEMTIVWHDLIEDPSDLPPSKSSVWSEEVYVQTKSGDRFNAAYYRGINKEEGWYNKIFMTELNQNDIVAWTYIPKYHNREKQIDDLLMKLPIMVFHRIKEGDKTNEYPKQHQFVIVFQYKEGKGIVSTVGFYDKDMGWMMPTIFKANKIIDINDVIGWSPFFKIHETHSDNKEQ